MKLHAVTYDDEGNEQEEFFHEYDVIETHVEDNTIYVNAREDFSGFSLDFNNIEEMKQFAHMLAVHIEYAS